MDIKIEIGQYKEINKGVLKASFSLVIYPQAQKILDCKYFVGDRDQQWFTFPQKEIKFADGRKTEYIPIVSYGDKQYLEQLKAAVLQALHTQGLNEAQNTRNSTNARKVSVQESNDGGELPF